jgi:hypothetical protein
VASRGFSFAANDEERKKHKDNIRLIGEIIDILSTRSQYIMKMLIISVILLIASISFALVGMNSCFIERGIGVTIGLTTMQLAIIVMLLNLWSYSNLFALIRKIRHKNL